MKCDVQANILMTACGLLERIPKVGNYDIKFSGLE
jgi:hypothetical protein